MNNQKNRFWTLCFSLMPGAGEMYFGLYRQGISIMLLFFALILVPVMLGVAALMPLAAIMWFYSFLHVHNLRAMTPEQFAQIEDKLLWEDTKINFKWNKKYKNWVGVALIVIGIYLLWNSVLSWLNWLLPDVFGYLFRRLPQAVVGALIIWLGVRLIWGKQHELNEEETYDESAENVTEFTDIPEFKSAFTAEPPAAPEVPAIEAAAAEKIAEETENSGEQKEDNGNADA